MILGIHCSVLRGFASALEEAVALGCGAMQMLPFRRHHEPSPEELSAFREARARSGVARLLVHSRFVPSLASSDEARRARSVELLAFELKLAAGLGAEAYVLHAGAYSPGGSAREGMGFAAESIRRAEPALPVLVENVPGGGRRIGGTLEELAEILDALGRMRVPASACLDTAHAWAAGYELSTAEGMLKFLAKAHRLLGAENVRAFHLNDTRALLGTHREHHWHWGKGYLGSEGLKTLLHRPEYAAAVGIVETPKGGESDRENLGFVREALK